MDAARTHLAAPARVAQDSWTHLLTRPPSAQGPLGRAFVWFQSVPEREAAARVDDQDCRLRITNMRLEAGSRLQGHDHVVTIPPLLRGHGRSARVARMGARGLFVSIAVPSRASIRLEEVQEHG